MNQKRAQRISATGIGCGALITGAAPLEPYILSHLADPQVDVIALGTIATYLSEIFLEVDAVGVWPTVAAWLGVVMLAGVAASYSSHVDEIVELGVFWTIIGVPIFLIGWMTQSQVSIWLTAMVVSMLAAFLMICNRVCPPRVGA